MEDETERRIARLEKAVDSLTATRNWALGAWSVVVVLLGVFILPLLSILIRFIIKGL